MSQSLTVLIVGGYGIFGGRIVALLADEPRLTLIIAGRSLARAEAFCTAHAAARAQLVPAAFDRSGELAAGLVTPPLDLVVDASGPFQAYGDRPYALVQACIAGRVDYLDLADGSAFVAGIAAFNQQARAAGVCALSGMSTCPSLTAAAVRRLASGTARVDSIRAGIAPSPKAGVGLNVVRAVASYAGRPLKMTRNGRQAGAYPFTEQMRFTIAPPGIPPLRSKMFSLADAPDLLALPPLWPGVKTVWVGAAPAPEILHRLLIACAWLVRVHVAPTLSPMAEMMHRAMEMLRWGEHRGGMFVELEGEDAAGAAIKRSWHMIAEGDDGPFIPAMATAALARKMLNGYKPEAGARAAARELELDDYEGLFRQRAIASGVRDDAPRAETGLYERILGPAWSALPPAIRAMHDVDRSLTAEGRASVERGRSVLARLTGFLIGFPKQAADTPVSVRFDASNGRETWTRTFGRARFSSRQFAGGGRSDRLLCERFGPLTFAMALVLKDQKLCLALRRWSAFGIPLPIRLSPRSNAYERAEDGRFRFHVEISHPFTGLIVRYRGWLEPTR